MLALLPNTGYFVFGTVTNFYDATKLFTLILKKVDDTPFTLVVFEPHFKYFTYKDDQLLNMDVLAYGFFKKNDFNGKNETEMVIKSNKYIERVKRKKKELPKKA